MHWASALAEDESSEKAIDDVVKTVRARLGSAEPQLVTVFISSQHAAAADVIGRVVSDAFPGAAVTGCLSDGVVGGGREREEGPVVALGAAVLPGAHARAFHLGEEAGDGPAIAAAVGVPSGDLRGLLLFADPWSCDATVLLPALDATFETAVKVGGLASGGAARGSSLLFEGARVHRNGVVGIALSGAVAVDAIVAQGCRPVGEPMIVTRSRGHVVQELGKRPPLEILRELFDTASDRDRELLRTALFVGVEMRKSDVRFREGSLLVRNVVGLDPKTGSLAVATPVQDWDVLQFVVRDAEAAHEDLLARLREYRASNTLGRPDGAMLFSCTGRGARLFGKENHDSELFREHVTDAPLVGFFCNGEIGPIGSATYLHGYTSVFALFRTLH